MTVDRIINRRLREQQDRIVRKVYGICQDCPRVCTGRRCAHCRAVQVARYQRQFGRVTERGIAPFTDRAGSELPDPTASASGHAVRCRED